TVAPKTQQHRPKAPCSTHCPQHAEHTKTDKNQPSTRTPDTQQHHHKNHRRAKPPNKQRSSQVNNEHTKGEAQEPS
ncbi:hypothetical protein, partial [Glutamicibacter ardleyensis]|uniref:hypothetical protein n=1 Tax=Glutamicibacter ardleyensis TaxID=225894 RepID=UPI003FD04B2F